MTRRDAQDGTSAELSLSERQAMVLRALVSAYVGHAGPVGSASLAPLLSTPLSPASIRNTLGELHGLGLIEKAHASAGRVPTVEGLRLFVDRLLEVGDLGPHHQRLLDREFDGIDAGEAPRQASQILSQHTRQLGFVLAPRVEHLSLASIHLVPVSSGRILAVLVARNGAVIERVVDVDPPLSPRELERVRALLVERLAGGTLAALRRRLEAERASLRGEADDLLRRAWALGLEACRATSTTPAEALVIATRLALLDQPEFADPERIRGLFAALETNERLLTLLTRLARGEGVGPGVGLSMSLGVELGEPALRDCALVVRPYGASDGLPEHPAEAGAQDAGGASSTTRARSGVAPIDHRAGFGGTPAAGAGGDGDLESGDEFLGVLGVIGPRRMDYGRVIPLVDYCSRLVTRKLRA